MIVLSAGMYKAGSGWYFNCTNDLLVSAGYQDVRQVREQYHLESILGDYNCNIGRHTFYRFARVSVPHFRHNTFVIKTHTGPNRLLQGLVKTNIVKATYIYRDPRDVMLSLLDHADQLRQEGRNQHHFAKIADVEDGLERVKQWLAIWDAWHKFDNVLMVRYEDFSADPVKELERLAQYLSISVEPDTLRKIIAKYKPDQLDESQREHLHFNKGYAGRFRDELSPEQQALCLEHIGEYLVKMGYPQD